MTRPISERLAVVAAALSDEPREAPRRARVAGFRGLLVDVWSSRLGLPELSASGRREFSRLLSSEDQQLAGLQMALGPKGLMPGADVDREVFRLNRAMEVTAQMAAPALCVDLGPLPEAAAASKPRQAIPPQQAGLIIIPVPARPEPAPIKPPDPAAVAQLNAALAEIGAAADRFSVTLAFSSSLAGFAALDQALSDARCPWFGVDLDPVAMLRDEWVQDEIFSRLGGSIRHVRARDAVVADRRRTKPVPVGQGSLVWADLLRSLDQTGYNGFLSVDPLDLPDRARAALVAAEYFKNM